MAAPFKVLMFDSKKYDIDSFDAKLKEKNLENKIQFHYLLERISPELVEAKAPGFDGVCIFVNDNCDEAVVNALAKVGVKLIVLRCAGFNNVAVSTATQHGIKIVRVPAYSPHAVAEYSLGMLLTLVRKLHTAYNRTKINNFALEGLVGFDLYGKTVGIVGTGKIGKCAVSVFRGLGCRILAYDVYEDKKAAEELGFTYTSLDELLRESDVVSLYAPLTKDNHHMIGKDSIPKMKKGVHIINTGRGPLIDSVALIEGLKSGHIGGACLDVYEFESGIFYNDVSEKPLQDDILARLLSFNNVFITSHQAYLSEQALNGISQTSVDNLIEFIEMKSLTNEVTEAMVA